jgi:hypothetical protein
MRAYPGTFWSSSLRDQSYGWMPWQALYGSGGAFRAPAILIYITLSRKNCTSARGAQRASCTDETMSASAIKMPSRHGCGCVWDMLIPVVSGVDGPCLVVEARRTGNNARHQTPIYPSASEPGYRLDQTRLCGAATRLSLGDKYSMGGAVKQLCIIRPATSAGPGPASASAVRPCCASQASEGCCAHGS